ncbi:MAG: carbon storage regulator CsrA [Armatimonadetes bacterium]|nr:carbon storage regulator CsrA [Armatimonadota bacterium]
MLVLTRQVDEQVLIGENITITVVSVSGSQVRLGIEAPRSIPVHRREVHDTVAAQNQQSSHSSPTALRRLAATRERR